MFVDELLIMQIQCICACLVLSWGIASFGHTFKAVCLALFTCIETVFSVTERAALNLPVPPVQQCFWYFARGVWVRKPHCCERTPVSADKSHGSDQGLF